MAPRALAARPESCSNAPPLKIASKRLAATIATPHKGHMVPLSFAGHDFQVIDSLALFWPAQSALIVADLHLEKASWFAKFGQHLPPYDSHATLVRLSEAAAICGAQNIYCLGDNFHDEDGEQRLSGAAAQVLQDMTARLNWVWITGNHDAKLGGLSGHCANAGLSAPINPSATTLFGGDVVEEMMVGGIALRHQAHSNDPAPQMSGHFHPKHKIHVRGRSVRRACFVKSPDKLLLPAFGAFTGGMAADDPAVLASFGTDQPIAAAIATRERMVYFALTPLGKTPDLARG